MMESIKNLRDYMEQHDPVNDKSDEMIRAATLDALEDYADAIEHEISERYMLLPVDADGVPIHVGDRLDWCNEEIEVMGVCDDSVWFEPYNSEQEWMCVWSNACHHVKPRTVEDVLRDFAIACEDAGFAGPDVTRQINKYAAELQMRGDAE